MFNCGFPWSLGAGSLSWVFPYLKEGIEDSWQCAISCVHIHQACWRLENSCKMAGGVQHVHSRPLPTHTDNDALSTISTGKNTTEAPDPGLKLYLPPTEPHTAKSIGNRQANAVVFTYILGYRYLSHTKSSTFDTGASILRSRVEIKESRCDFLTFRIPAGAIIPHLSVLPVMWPAA